LKIRVEYLAKIKEWAQKYLKSDLSHLDIDGLQEQIEFIVDYFNQLK